MSEPTGTPRQRISTEPDTVERDLVKLVLTIVELLRQLMERQAIRRVDNGGLTLAEEERIGLTLMLLDDRMARLRDRFDITEGDLNLSSDRSAHCYPAEGSRYSPVTASDLANRDRAHDECQSEEIGHGCRLGPSSRVLREGRYGALESLEASVVVVGGGPVGLTLAMDLGSRGVDVVVVEQRHAAEAPSVRCNHVSARSMEIFRRLGVSAALRDAGLPADHPNDVAFRTTFVGIEFGRIPIPCRRDRYTATDGPDTWWPTPEPPHRINQIYMEPVLFAHAEAQRGVTILNRVVVEAVTETSQGVETRARHRDSGDPVTITSAFLVGSDGGRSLVRRQLGISLQGDAVVQRVQSTYIRAPGLLERLNSAPAWATIIMNPRRSGTAYAIDGRETWLIHNYLRAEEKDFEAVDRDWALRTILGVDGDFEYQLLANEDWFGRRLIADRFRHGRIFLCGDSAHIWVPYAGYGMNAGIADAADLAWLLAAHLAGWAPPAILDAYERERRPITDQVSRFAMDHAERMIRSRRRVPADIEADGPAGDAARASFGRSLVELNVAQYCCAGLNFGYYYDDSPIIGYDGETHPPYTMGDFTPATVPGCRVPHIWLANGGSLYDALGADYTLLKLDRAVDTAGLEHAARQRGLPLAVLDLTDETPPADARSLMLVRPDQHIAWRDDAEPRSPLTLIDLVRGAA